MVTDKYKPRIKPTEIGDTPTGGVLRGLDLRTLKKFTGAVSNDLSDSAGAARVRPDKGSTQDGHGDIFENIKDHLSHPEYSSLTDAQRKEAIDIINDIFRAFSISMEKGEIRMSASGGDDATIDAVMQYATNLLDVATDDAKIKDAIKTSIEIIAFRNMEGTLGTQPARADGEKSATTVVPDAVTPKTGQDSSVSDKDDGVKGAAAGNGEDHAPTTKDDELPKSDTSIVPDQHVRQRKGTEKTFADIGRERIEEYVGEQLEYFQRDIKTPLCRKGNEESFGKEVSAVVCDQASVQHIMKDIGKASERSALHVAILSEAIEGSIVQTLGKEIRKREKNVHVRKEMSGDKRNYEAAEQDIKNTTAERLQRIAQCRSAEEMGKMPQFLFSAKDVGAIVARADVGGVTGQKIICDALAGNQEIRKAFLAQRDALRRKGSDGGKGSSRVSVEKRPSPSASEQEFLRTDPKRGSEKFHIWREEVEKTGDEIERVVSTMGFVTPSDARAVGSAYKRKVAIAILDTPELGMQEMPSERKIALVRLLLDEIVEAKRRKDRWVL